MNPGKGSDGSGSGGPDQGSGDEGRRDAPAAPRAARVRRQDLRRRFDELAIDGSAYAVTSALADRDRTGAAGALLEALKDEWAAEGAVAVLYPATEELMGYFAQRGAVPDQGAQRRMIFNYRRCGDQ